MSTRSPLTRRCLALVGLCALLVLTTAPSFTTAHISEFKVGRDANLTQEATEFGPVDTIYAVCRVANVPGKVTLKIQTIAEKVEGVEDNYHVPIFDKSYDIDKDSRATYTLYKPTAGWHAGLYRLEARLYSDGEEKSMKTLTFRVVAPAGAPAAPASPTP